MQYKVDIKTQLFAFMANVLPNILTCTSEMLAAAKPSLLYTVSF